MTEKINESNYDSSTFCLAISLPQCLVLREVRSVLDEIGCFFKGNSP